MFFDIKNYFKSKRIWYIFIFITYVSISTIIPALIPKKKVKGISNNNNFFEQVKNKYPELFKKINYPLSNIFINNLITK